VDHPPPLPLTFRALVRTGSGGLSPPLRDQLLDCIRAAACPSQTHVNGAPGRARLIMEDAAAAFPSFKAPPSENTASDVTAGSKRAGSQGLPRPRVHQIRLGRSFLRMVKFDDAATLSELTGTEETALTQATESVVGRLPYDGTDDVGLPDCCITAAAVDGGSTHGDAAVGGPRVQVPDVRAWRVPVPRPGRPLGSGLDLRASTGDAVVVALCRSLLAAVKEEFSDDRYRAGIFAAL